VCTAAAHVTIVIVNYESYPELRNCLASLAADAAAGHEIVVVDHVSREGAADALSQEFPFVRLLRVPANEGFAAGVNRGARGARTPFLLLLNPDSLVDPGLVDRLCAWMDDKPDVGVVGPRLLNTDGSVQGSARRFPDFTTALAGRSSWLTKVLPRNPLSRRNLPAAEAVPGHPMDVDWISGACMLIRRSAFEQVAGMDEGFFLYWEDADFCRRLKQAGWRTVYLPDVTSMHIGGRSSMHAADASLAAFHRSAYRFFCKHSSAPVRTFAPLVYLALRARLMFVRRIVRAKRRDAGGGD
jgi:GT2 family glycosyltransferase